MEGRVAAQKLEPVEPQTIADAPVRRPWRGSVQRLVSAAVAVPFAVAAILLLPAEWFLVLCVVLVEWGAAEYLRLLRPRAPGAPLWVLLFAVPPAALVVGGVLSGGLVISPASLILGAGLLSSVALGSLLLLSRTPLSDVLASVGILGFGVTYFALPAASLYALKELDPWLVFWLCAIVWLGDSAAYYCGSAFGRHRMAPVVSPRKTWEGAAAGLAAGILASAAWSYHNLGQMSWSVMGVGAGTAVAAQVGDLVESLLKRSVGAKDSGAALPGHGGALDRLDALLFAAPVFLAGLWLIEEGMGS